jgi:hypothetical protein
MNDCHRAIECRPYCVRCRDVCGHIFGVVFRPAQRAVKRIEHDQGGRRRLKLPPDGGNQFLVVRDQIERDRL